MTRLVIGAYTAEMDGNGRGLTVVPGSTVETPSPSFAMADGDLLYAVHEGDPGAVSSFRLSAGGSMTLLSTQPTGGAEPCHLTRHDGHVLCANYGSGSVSVHPVSADGIIGERTDLVQHSGSGPDPERQDGPHAHQVRVAGDGTITVVDLGIDRLVQYRLSDGRLHHTGEIAVPAGSGPRHYVVHPDGRWFVSAELGSAVLTIAGGVYVASVPATRIDVFNQPSAIALSADARHVYLANRGAETISVFTVGDRELTFLGEVGCGGAWPRDLVIHGDRLYVANQKSDNVAVFGFGPDGLPVPAGDPIVTGSPTSVLAIEP
jgi:6-phosphogluconolactonase